MSAPQWEREAVGLIPCAGLGSRIAPLPCSKELYPVGFRSDGESGSARPKVVTHYLLEKMRFAGIRKVYLVLRHGKWDIPAYFGDGSMIGMSVGYLMMGAPFGPPYTLDQAFPFVRNSLVAFGFPDILFKTKDVFVRAFERQAASGADVVLALFPSRQPQLVDMVELEGNGRVCAIVTKPTRTQLKYTWGTAIWTPQFTDFMHRYLAKRQKTRRKRASLSRSEELSMGEVIQAAIEHKLNVDSVCFPGDACLDVGTPEDLVKALSFNRSR